MIGKKSMVYNYFFFFIKLESFTSGLYLGIKGKIQTYTTLQKIVEQFLKL